MSSDQPQERAKAEQPSERCGFEFDANVGFGEESRACCWRETYDDADRCRWHLDEQKEGAVSEYQLLAEGDSPFVEFVLRDASLASTDVFADHTLARADLSGADLRDADLSGADLRGANFSGADLSSAELCEADLRDATFDGADLAEAALTDADARRTSFESADLENALLTRANLRNASLHDARLYEVGFSDTWINEGTGIDDRCVYERDAEASLDRDDRDIARHDAAAWTYRALEDLCRDNALPERTRHYFIREKDSRRKAAWETGDYVHAIKSELSRWVMEYGSNPWRVVGFSTLVILTFALLYPLTGHIEDMTLPEGSRAIGYFVEQPAEAPRYYITVVFLKSFYFSVVTFATLGYGDIRPVGTLARMLATVETGLGSLLIALLVFVLSRSVTW
jgi:uncharacterized protein YjbI with pentapeptide repeats